LGLVPTRQKAVRIELAVEVVDRVGALRQIQVLAHAFAIEVVGAVASKECGNVSDDL
jgi:hypothetical protein